MRGGRTLSPQPGVMPREGGAYAAASRLDHYRLWDTGSPAFAGDDSGDGEGFGAYPKYLCKIPRYTLVSFSRSATGTRSSIWCMVWPTRPNSITGQ